MCIRMHIYKKNMYIYIYIHISDIHCTSACIPKKLLNIFYCIKLLGALLGKIISILNYYKLILNFFWNYTDVNYSKLNAESDSVKNMHDDVTNKNNNLNNVFGEIPNNGPTIISNISFPTSILVLPDKKKHEETSLNER